MIRKVRIRVQWDGKQLELVKLISGGCKQSLNPWNINALTGDFNLTKDSFESLCKGEFEIVYKLKDKGEYVVSTAGVHKFFKEGDASGYAYNAGRFSFACFLPENWNEKRMSRDVRRVR